jgi:hypothetical protein
MSLEDDKRVIDKIRQCQRNWDLSKEIPDEHIQYWKYIATHSPSKQDEGYFNVRIIKNRDLIDQLKLHTWGQTVKVGSLKGVARNSQMGASVYILFTEKLSETPREIDIAGNLIELDDIVKTKNASVAAGIAGGLIAQSAASLGYCIGFNTNHSEPDIWHTLLRIRVAKESLMFGIGIGIPQENRPRNETDEQEFYIGGYPGQDNLITGLPNYPEGTEGTLVRLGSRSIMHDGKEHFLPKTLSYNTFSHLIKEIKVWIYE